MRHEKTRRLFAYWNSLRDGRLAPYRSEVDPRSIAPLLESTFILEHGPKATPRFRLAGSRLCDQFGLELRGMSALALWRGESRAKLRLLLDDVITEPRIGHVACTVETRGGHLFDAEFLYLPLRSDLGDMTRILGCGFYMGGFDHTQPGHQPIHHWIDTANLYPVDAPNEARAVAPRPAPTRRRGDEPGVGVMRATPSRTPPPRPSGPPRLRAIQGGLESKPARRARPEETVRRPTFLRLIKSDVG